MKRMIAVTLLLTMIMPCLAACENTTTNTSDWNLYSEASYDNESRFVPEEDSNEDNTSENKENSEQSKPLSGEFVVKDKKYTFEGNDLVIISVDNQTNKNYSVTITGTYLDKEGKTLKTETQTFDQYSAGYSNYFLFQPNMQFEKFTYNLDMKETDGPFYAKHVSVRFNRFYEDMLYILSQCEKDDWTKYPTVSDSLSWAYSGDTTTYIRTKCIYLNEKNEIIGICDRMKFLYVGDSFADGEHKDYFYQTTDKDFEMPEDWKGQIQLIPVIVSIVAQEPPPPPSAVQ